MPQHYIIFAQFCLKNFAQSVIWKVVEWEEQGAKGVSLKRLQGLKAEEFFKKDLKT